MPDPDETRLQSLQSLTGGQDGTVQPDGGFTPANAHTALLAAARAVVAAVYAGSWPQELEAAHKQLAAAVGSYPPASLSEPQPSPSAADDAQPWFTLKQQQSFHRIKLMFWRLTGQERLMVLINSGMVPESRTEPLPQTLELEILKWFLDFDQLAKLWRNIRPFLPKDKQDYDPFNPLDPI